MRLLMLVAGPALVIAACSGRNQADTTANADQSLSAQSFSSNDVTAIDAVTGDASNMAADVNYVVEFNDLGGGNDGSNEKSGKDTAPRRAPTNAAESNTTTPQPAANSTAATTANNAL